MKISRKLLFYTKEEYFLNCKVFISTVLNQLFKIGQFSQGPVITSFAVLVYYFLHNFMCTIQKVYTV